MGYMTALGIAESDLPLENQLRWHFSSNCYPPVPEVLVAVAVDAITAVNEGDFYAEVALPEGVTFRGESLVSAHLVIESLHLGAWITEEEE